MADEQDAQSGENQGQGKKKSKLVLFIIIGVSVVLLAVGGFFAYRLFFAPKSAEVTEDAAETVKTEKKAEIIGEIVSLEPFVVNLSDPKGKRYLKLKVELELDSPTAAEVVTKVMPKLRDTVIMMLTSLTFEEVMTPEGKIRIRDELLDRFNQILRPNRIKNIYFTEFVVQ